MGELHRATDQLVAYAIATRRDWTEDGVRRAIAEATTRGMAWPAIHAGLCRLMAQSKGLPGDLMPDARSAQPADPERTRALIAAFKRENEGRRPRGVVT